MTTHPESGSIELWLSVVRGIVGRPMEELSLLDLCCGECSATARLKWESHTGVDVVDWKMRSPEVHFWEMDALIFCNDVRYAKQYDLCICSDGIEHLDTITGWDLLEQMTRIAHLTIIFTPLGPYILNEQATHPDAHKSAWWPEELEGMGWTTQVYPNWHLGLGIGAFFAHKGALI